MRVGWCRPVGDAALLRDIGFDFVEVALAPLGLEDDATFAAARRAVAGAALPVAAFNTFLPQTLRVVGPDRDIPRYRAYLGRAAELVAGAGAEIVVFGSGWARTAPAGYDRERAGAEFLDALRLAADALDGTAATLAIEPLNRKESDLVNSVAEAAALAGAIDRANVKVLADFYHMDEEGERLETIVEHARWLAHVHLADTGRMTPGSGAYPYPRFVAQLAAARYGGMISAECGVRDVERDLRDGLRFLRQMLAEYGLQQGEAR